MPTEIELKLALPGSSQRRLLDHPLLGRKAESLGTTRLRNIYFDTPDLALHQRGMALRLRRQGRRWLQTVKCAGTVGGGLSERPEWEQPYNGSGFDFRSIDDVQVRRFLQRKRIADALTPVFETTFTRRNWRVIPEPGALVIAALDRGTISSGERSEAICELELELAEGDPAALFETARQLSGQIPLKPESLSKAERGYRLFIGAQPAPRKAAASALRAEDTPPGAFHHIALSCIAQLEANEAGVQRWDDPEYIHQMRVALRRLRSAVRVFSPVIAPQTEKTMHESLRRLGSALGSARDWDVVVDEVLAPVVQTFADDKRVEGLHQRALAKRDEARAAARAALADAEYGRIMLELIASLQQMRAGPAGQGDGDLRSFAQRRLRKLKRRVGRAAERAAGLEVSALHALRIAVKRLRYALEFFAPLYPRAAVKRELRRLTRLQQDLGLINDLANAGPRLEQCADDDVAMREAIALVGGWYGPRYAALLARLPAGIRALLKSRPVWRQ